MNAKPSKDASEKNKARASKQRSSHVQKDENIPTETSEASEVDSSVKKQGWFSKFFSKKPKETTEASGSTPDTRTASDENQKDGSSNEIR